MSLYFVDFDRKKPVFKITVFSSPPFRQSVTVNVTVTAFQSVPKTC